MNQTTNLFVQELKSKQLDTYTLGELQIALQQCKHLYVRFRGVEERHILNAMWNKMGHQYNHLLKQRFRHASSLYQPNYLLNLKEDDQEKAKEKAQKTKRISKSIPRVEAKF